MFEHIVLRRADGDLPISVGQIAEALLYYQKVRIFLDRNTLFDLIQKLGVGRLLTLLRRKELSSVYCEEILATYTETVGVSVAHNYITARLAGHEKIGALKTPAERLQYELERQGISKPDAVSFTKNFLAIAPIRRFSGNHFLPGGIAKAAHLDLLDAGYVEKAIREAVSLTPGGYVTDSNFKFEIISSDLGAFAHTNLDFEMINNRRAKFNPPLDPLTVAFLLSRILEARADLSLASFYGGDFATSKITSSIIQIRHCELLRRTKLNVDTRHQFTEIVLPDAPSLAEAIDSGERTIEEFLTLLDKAARFKDWLSGVNPDINLVQSYLRDVTKEGWIQKLPVKGLRYMLALGLDAGHSTTSLVFGLVDNFVLEKLFSGWRPSHFVSKRLSPFVRGY